MPKEERNYYEVLWYVGSNYYTKEFTSKGAALAFYEKYKKDDRRDGWWVTKRNPDGEVLEDYIY